MLDALPSASTGKILKHKLRELAIERAAGEGVQRRSRELSDALHGIRRSRTRIRSPTPH